MCLFWGVTTFGIRNDVSDLVVSAPDQRRLDVLQEDIKFNVICRSQTEYTANQKNLMAEIEEIKIERKACEHPMTQFIARATVGPSNSLASDIESCENRLMPLYQQFDSTLNKDVKAYKEAEIIAKSVVWTAKWFMNIGVTFSGFKESQLRDL